MFTRTARFYDAIYSFKDYAVEARAIDRIIKERNPAATTLLDVACGTGAHLEHLKTHYRAEGLDLDTVLLDVARAKNPDIRFHEANMTRFDLKRHFDAVTCLFSSIGYVRTEQGLDAAIGCMAAHLEDEGVLIVEPWLTPDGFEDGHLGSLFVDEPDLKIARVNTAERDGGVSRLHFEYLVATREGIDHVSEDHVLGLWPAARYVEAFEKAGLVVEHDPEGLMGRGLFVGRRRA